MIRLKRIKISEFMFFKLEMIHFSKQSVKLTP
jgi:hypothetical protein